MGWLIDLIKKMHESSSMDRDIPIFKEWTRTTEIRVIIRLAKSHAFLQDDLPSMVHFLASFLKNNSMAA
jgi:hypothetical protein